MFLTSPDTYNPKKLDSLLSNKKEKEDQNKRAFVIQPQLENNESITKDGNDFDSKVSIIHKKCNQKSRDSGLGMQNSSKKRRAGTSTPSSRSFRFHNDIRIRGGVVLSTIRKWKLKVSKGLRQSKSECIDNLNSKLSKASNKIRLINKKYRNSKIDFDSVNLNANLLNKLNQKRYSCNNDMNKINNERTSDSEEIKKKLKRNILLMSKVKIRPNSQLRCKRDQMIDFNPKVILDDSWKMNFPVSPSNELYNKIMYNDKAKKALLLNLYS